MEIYKAMIPLEPKTKKNHQVIKFRKQGTNGFYKRTSTRFLYMGIPFVSQSDQYKQYENDAGWFLKKPEKPIDCPVNVKCIFYRKTARRVDLTNLLEAIDDVLVKFGILADDNFNIITGHDGSRVRIDREKPRTEIIIETDDDARV